MMRRCLSYISYFPVVALLLFAFFREISVPRKGTVTREDAVHEEEHEIYNNIDVATDISRVQATVW